jgi:NitT/TauT family transport system ATP-binding protein
MAGMIEFEQVSFSYPKSQPIFQDFSWFIERGERWAVLGPSGCGKTTLLYLLAGLAFATQGMVRIEGQALTRPRPRTGLILQDFGLLPWATVRENTALGVKVRNYYGPDGKHTPEDYLPQDDIDYWLERLNLQSVANQYPGKISGGQRQRTAISRTLVLQPDILLMDEPFASLDAPTRQDLQNLTLKLHNEAQLTSVIVTHAIEEAAIIGQKILLLGYPPIYRGKVIDNPGAAGENFRNSPEFWHICQFLHQHLEQKA